MARPCDACDQPVHDHVVICPHCGRPTGVAPDPKLTVAEASALIATERKPSLPTDDPARAEAEALAGLAELPGIAGVVGAAAVVGAAVVAVVDSLRETGDKPGLPTAIAHVRRRHLTPLPSVEPERTEPPADGEEPRFLK